MPTDERPLHPDGGGRYVYQHPVKGCIWHIGDGTLQCYVEDIGKGSHDEDRQIRIGQPAATRLALGDWLNEVMPFRRLKDKEREMEMEMKRRLQHQRFVEANFPLDWDGETPESIQLIERVDMTHSVMEAGGACTICEAPPPDHDHRIGCEYVSALLHQIEEMSKPDHEPTLSEVVQRANEQIARMA